MKNPFFNLPDFGGDLLDFRLALRLFVRQAFKPMLGTSRHTIPVTHHMAASTSRRHTVTTPSGKFLQSFKLSLRDKFRTIVYAVFPAARPALNTFAVKTVHFNPALSKSSGRKSLPASPVARDAQSSRNGSAAAGNELSKGTMKPLAKSVHKSASKNGKRIPANTKRITPKNVTGNTPRSRENKGGIVNAEMQSEITAAHNKGNVNKAAAAGNQSGTSRCTSGASRDISGALRDGMWVEYNKHAIVIARGSYVNNMKTGMWREYYDTGELMIEEHFVLGVQHGRFATFHPNGQCCSDGMYEEGRREGQFFLYDESGNHVRSLTFKRDILVEDIMIEQRLAMA